MIPERTSYDGQSYKLYDDYNEIHIFVEDKGFENLYRVIFKKYGINVENIFSKNGKAEVLQSAETCSDSKCVFIVDRDWDDLHGNMPTLNNIVVLKMHSIENYLIDYDAFLGIVLGDNPKCDINSLFGREDFEIILINTSNKLRNLFACFAAMQQVSEVRERGCSYAPGHFQQANKTCAPDISKITQFISDSGVEISQQIDEYFQDEVLFQKGHGKFMLHYVWQEVKNKARLKILNNDKLMMRLAQLTETPALEGLATAVKNNRISHES